MKLEEKRGAFFQGNKPSYPAGAPEVDFVGLALRVETEPGVVGDGDVKFHLTILILGRNLIPTMRIDPFAS